MWLNQYGMGKDGGKTLRSLYYSKYCRRQLPLLLKRYWIGIACRQDCDIPFIVLLHFYIPNITNYTFCSKEVLLYVYGKQLLSAYSYMNTIKLTSGIQDMGQRKTVIMLYGSEAVGIYGCSIACVVISIIDAASAPHVQDVCVCVCTFQKTHIFREIEI